MTIIDFGGVHWLGVGAAIVWSMLFGFLWYSPFLFGKPWMKLAGHTMESAKAGQGPAMPFAIGAAILYSLALGVLARATMAEEWMDGAELGFLAGIGLAVPIIMTEVAFYNRNKNLVWFNGLAHTIQWTVAGILITALG